MSEHQKVAAIITLCVVALLPGKLSAQDDGIQSKTLQVGAVGLEPFAVKRYQDTVIVTGAIEGNRIENLTIIDKNEDNQKRVISARYGFLSDRRLFAANFLGDLKVR